jgi:hypothetical protein
MKKAVMHAAAMLLYMLAVLPIAARAIPPAVEIASPVSGATVCGTITISATASDPIGVAGVQFKYNGINLGAEDTSVPYKVLAKTSAVTDGVYVLTAVARNESGEQTTSEPVTVTVDNSAPYCSPKFIPTFLVYYGGGQTLTCGKEWELGKFDLLDVVRWRYFQINDPDDPTSPCFNTNTWARVRSVNPNIEIYLYENGPEEQNFGDNTDVWYLQGIGRYNISRGHSMGSLNGDHPELFLLDSLGDRIYNSGYSGGGNFWYLMDFGAAAFQSYWLEAVRADIVAQAWAADGVHADNCLTLISRLSPYSGVPVAPNDYSTDSRWVPAMNGFASAITSGLHSAGQKLWCNRGGGYSRFPEGKQAWLDLDALVTPPDVAGEEGAFAVTWGPLHWSTQFYPEPEWKLQLETLAAIRNSKVAVFAHTKLDKPDSGSDNWNQPVTFWQSLWYALGSFLLGKQDSPNNAYFYFAGKGGSHNEIWYFDEYDLIDLGKAVAPYTATVISGSNIYWREFEKGYVYVNPTTGTVWVTLPTSCTSCRQRTHQNLYTPASQLPVVTSIQLNAHHAAIVLKN